MTNETLETKVESRLLRKPLLESESSRSLHTDDSFENCSDDQTWTTYEFYCGDGNQIDSIIQIFAERGQFDNPRRGEYLSFYELSGNYLELKDKQELPSVGKRINPSQRAQISSFEAPLKNKVEIEFDQATFRDLLQYLSKSTQYQFREDFDELGVAKTTREMGFPTKDTMVQIHKIVRGEKVLGRSLPYELIPTNIIFPAYKIAGNGVRSDLPKEYDQRWDNGVSNFIVGKRSYTLHKKTNKV